MQAKVYEYFLDNNEIEILICEDDKEAEISKQAALLANKNVFVLPDFRANFKDDLRSFQRELFGISIELSKFYEANKNKLLISPYKTILNKLPAKKHLKPIEISFGDEITNLYEKLTYFGYQSVDMLSDFGEFSIRGDIVDVFGLGEQRPFRICFFDNEVESIRYFDIQSQLSDKNELEKIKIFPFLAALSKDEYLNLENKISELQSDALVSDIASLGFWLIDDFIDLKNSFKYILLKDLGDEIEGEILPPAKEYKELVPIFNDDFFNFHKNKNLKIIASSKALFDNFLLANNIKNANFIKNEAIINLLSKDEILISLNKNSKKKIKRAPKLILDELSNGDFVVHEDYGIGKFLGLKTHYVLGSNRDYIEILYQNNDKLLLPVENLNLIDRYVGNLAELDKLGSKNFIKLKDKVRQKLFVIAAQIIATAAKRQLEQGIKFKEQDTEGLNFIASAGFEYTQDQINAVNEILNELSSGKLMDKLLSADVGFGKTEVAMNAIFACLNSGYQALFFAPTTLLASQHYKSLKSRGFNVFKLDRFSKNKKQILEIISSGEPIVCVGTHSLLSADPTKLGLIVVDEEHKFGVKQKEQLKQLSSKAHILSMSATPIPRSLNMALSKIKSYCVLKNPPSSRLDIKTIVKIYNEVIVKEAILRELRRGGQIFYIHNQISDIELSAKKLKEILPKLKILILHSKINASKSEEEMLKFENGEYDLLLCTSIVESGIHLPNANTIIIENAQKFGMADLHQLRGRVGRSDKQGYCYFFVSEKLSDQAKKRLVALENNSYLGSGSVLAYHDLEIRGGGNIIGDAQSGHIEAIGYSLYLKMLEEEINKLLNKETKEHKIELKLNISAFLNPDLVNSDRLRLEIYKRLSACKSVMEVGEIAGEIEDRFGKLDRYTKQFLQLINIKIMGQKLNFKFISNYNENISLVKENGEKINFKANSKDDDDILNEIIKYLRNKL